MAVELPEFITIDFFQKIFEKNFANGKELFVLNFWGEMATKPGDNYASEMYRVTVDYEVESEKIRKAVILKVSYEIKYLNLKNAFEIRIFGSF